MSIIWVSKRKFRSPCESIRKISLPVKIMCFPTRGGIGSGCVIRAMAKVSAVSLDLLPQTCLSVPERVLIFVCGPKLVVAKDSMTKR